MLPYVHNATRMTMLQGFSFHVTLSVVPLAFQKISSLQETIETVQVNEGGVNHYTHSLRGPVTQERTLVMEKGIPVGNKSMEMANVALDSQLFKVGNRFPYALILVCNQNIARISRAYLVTGLMMKSWSLSDLDAMSSNYLIERLEFTYQTIERHAVQIPLLAAGSGYGKARVQPRPPIEESVETTETAVTTEYEGEAGG